MKHLRISRMVICLCCLVILTGCKHTIIDETSAPVTISPPIKVVFSEMDIIKNESPKALEIIRFRTQRTKEHLLNSSSEHGAALFDDRPGRYDCAFYVRKVKLQWLSEVTVLTQLAERLGEEFFFDFNHRAYLQSDLTGEPILFAQWRFCTGTGTNFEATEIVAAYDAKSGHVVSIVVRKGKGLKE